MGKLNYATLGNRGNDVLYLLKKEQHHHQRSHLSPVTFPISGMGMRHTSQFPVRLYTHTVTLNHVHVKYNCNTGYGTNVQK